MELHCIRVEKASVPGIIIGRLKLTGALQAPRSIPVLEPVSGAAARFNPSPYFVMGGRGRGLWKARLSVWCRSPDLPLWKPLLWAKTGLSMRSDALPLLISPIRSATLCKIRVG